MQHTEYDDDYEANEDRDGHRRGRGIFWWVLIGTLSWIAILGYAAWLVTT